MRMITLGEFRALTKDLPDGAHFGLKLDSEDLPDLVLSGVTLDQRAPGWVDIHVCLEEDREDDETEPRDDEGEDLPLASAPRQLHHQLSELVRERSRWPDIHIAVNYYSSGNYRGYGSIMVILQVSRDHHRKVEVRALQLDGEQLTYSQITDGELDHTTECASIDELLGIMISELPI